MVKICVKEVDLRGRETENRVDRFGRNPDPPFHFMRIYT